MSLCPVCSTSMPDRMVISGRCTFASASTLAAQRFMAAPVVLDRYILSMRAAGKAVYDAAEGVLCAAAGCGAGGAAAPDESARMAASTAWKLSAPLPGLTGRG